MFWLYEDDLPPGVGSEPFCAMHLLYIAFFLTATVCYAFLYKRLGRRSRNIADRVLGSLVFFFALCAYGITALLGHFSLFTLPLHLCSLIFCLTPVHAWTGAAQTDTFAARLRSFLSAVILFPGIPGVWAALLFPDWLYVPFRNYLSVAAFMAHGLASVYGASLIVKSAEAADQRVLFLRDLTYSLFFLSVGAVLMFFFDRAAGTNYWFMAGPGYGSPFAGVYAAGAYSGYLIAFLFTAVVVTAVWFALRYFLFVRNRE